MASFRKRQNKWQARIQRKGFPDITKSFTQFSVASQWARKIERELDLGICDIKVSKTKLCILLQKYQTTILPQKKSPSADHYRINRILGYAISDLNIEDIRSSHVVAFRDQLVNENKSGNTVRLYLAILSHLFTIAKTEWGYDLNNPAIGIRKPRLNPVRETRLTDNAIKKLIENTRSPHLPIFIKISLETAMRVSEICRLEWDDIQDHYLLVRETKNGRNRTVPISADLRTLINSIPRINTKIFSIKPEAISLAFRRAAFRAAIKGSSFHTLRHEAISRLVENRVDLITVSMISGHQSMQMLKRYAHLKIKHLVKSQI